MLFFWLGGGCKVATPIFNDQATLVTLKLRYMLPALRIGLWHSYYPSAKPEMNDKDHIALLLLEPTTTMTTNEQDSFIGWVGENIIAERLSVRRIILL